MVFLECFSNNTLTFLRSDAVFSMQQIVQGDKSYYEIFKTII